MRETADETQADTAIDAPARSAAERSVPKRYLGCVALVVDDYDRAIAYYTDALGFELREDSPRGEGKRWVVVAPPGAQTALLLARADNETQRAAIGRHAGGRVGLFLHTDDFARDYPAMRAKGVRFTETPREEDYGTVAVFEDLYGNRWDLLQLRASAQKASGQNGSEPNA
jgi:catechol 2,3-dioxygenase-like lactoylglutathione lyase family enzyme